MSTDTSHITDQAVLHVIKMNLPGFGDTAELTVDTDLWAAGMDSLANISVMIAIENTFAVEFPDEFLTHEVFSTASRIAGAVRQIAAT